MLEPVSEILAMPLLNPSAKMHHQILSYIEYKLFRNATKTLPVFE